MLTRSLLRRGHAAVTPVAAPSATSLGETLQRSLSGLPAALGRARTHPAWTRLGDKRKSPADPTRSTAQADLTEVILKVLQRPAETPLTFP